MMEKTKFWFKLCGTFVVLAIALTITGWSTDSDIIWGIDAFIAILAGIALVIAIIMAIWEAE